MKTIAGWTTLFLAAFLPAGKAWIPLGREPWRDGPISVSFGFTAAAPDINHGWEGAVREAADTWNSTLQRVRLEVVPPTGRVWYENGHNEVFFDRNLYGEPFPTGVLGVSFATLDRGVLVETDVVINPAYDWAVYRGQPRADTMDFRRVVLHELGHLLGLGHPDEHGQTAPAIMQSRMSEVELPTADDREGMRALYTGIGSAPVIVRQPDPVRVKQGAMASFTVAAGGRGPLHHEWRRNGTALPGETRNELRLTARREDAGVYTVVVQNEAGFDVSREARLEVGSAVPPGPSVGLTVDQARPPAGSEVTLRASLASGDAPLRFEWRKDGLLLTSTNAPSLTLPEVKFSDTGSYTVTATNAGGTSVSHPLRLEVMPAEPLRLTSEVTSATLGLGEAITLTAPVAATAGLRYQWRRDGVPIPGATGRTLHLPQAEPGPVATYSVVVTGAYGSVTSTGGRIATLPPAGFAIVRQPGSLTAEIGESARMEVETFPPARSYRWYKDGVALTPSPGRHGEQSAILEIPALLSADAGVYHVEAEDGTNRVRSQDARLRVHYPGRGYIVSVHPSDRTVVDGAPVELATAVQPTATGATYQWLKDGLPVAGATASRLSLVMGPGVPGRYRARITLGPLALDSEEASVERVPVRQLFGAHPTGEVYFQNSPVLGLVAVNEEVERRRSERSGQIRIYRRDGLVVSSPYSALPSPPARFTLTISEEGVVETSRPFTLGAAPPPGGADVRLHPRGGTFMPGSSPVLEVQATEPDAVYSWRRDGVAIAAGTLSRLELGPFTAQHAGTYTVRVSNGQGSAVSEPALVQMWGHKLPLIAVQPQSVTATAGARAELVVTSRRPGVRYQWRKDGVPVAAANHSFLTLIASASTAGSYAVEVTDGIESELSLPVTLRVLAAVRPPAILIPPAPVAGVLGGDAELAAVVDGAPLPDRYQWYKDGAVIPGATEPKLRLTALQPSDAGRYSVAVASSAGSTVSPAVMVTVDERSRLVNLATRAVVGLGQETLVAGFTIGGARPRPVLVRGIGDQLSEFGVTGVLRDPVIRIFDQQARLLASNDDWFRTTDEEIAVFQAAAREVGAFPQRLNARDAAVITTLAPGSYTAEVAGLVETTGVGLVEIYELGRPDAAHLVNLSSRAAIGPDGDLLIPGFVLSGRLPRRVLIRAIGPGLAEFGVAGAVEDPMVALFRDVEKIATNDDWQTGQPEGPLVAAMAAVGAFPLRPGSRDAALLLELPPGNYTVQVEDAQRRAGTAMVEVYELP